MHRRAALIVSSAVVLLLVAPRAPGASDVPGDPSPPVVTPVIAGTLGNAGWYTTNVTVNWSVTDPESIILSTTGCNATTLTTNTTGTRLSCSAESDGGTTSVSKTLKLDKTAPAASTSASRTPDTNGWYNHSVRVSFAAVDTTSGVESCSAPVDYAGPDTSGTAVAGTCRDQAGNTSSATQPLKYDATPPIATATPARTANANGWYSAPIGVSFAATDPIAGVASCSAPKTYSGPDSAAAEVTGTCTDAAGNVGSKTIGLNYDATPPQVTASPARAVGPTGWYRAPVAVGFAAADAMSGVDACDADKTYSGPDSATAAVAGVCRDRAGNSGSASLPLKYDATAPTLLAVTSKAGNRSAHVAWRMSSDTAVVEVVRVPGRNGQGETVIYRGSETGLRDTGLVPGRKYEYRVAAVDQASNRVERKAEITATGALFSPLPGAVVAAPPTLAWARVKGAAYYNVLLMRGRKILSAWPTRTSFRVPKTWRYKGRRYALRPGVYRWYVFPGFGRITAARYGRLLGGSTFVFRP